MKKILAALLLMLTSLIGFAQCDKKVTITASKTEYLGADSSLQRAEDEKTVVEFDKTAISITPGNEGRTMSGTITSYVCNWQTPYKVGKTRMKVTLTSPQGETKNITITIEGQKGKIIFLAEMDDNPDKKIRLNVDKFEERM